MAGLFLREFVPDGIPWAHPHIAGPAFNERAAFGHTPRVAPAPPYGPWYGWPRTRRQDWE